MSKEQAWAYQSLFLLICIICGYLLGLDTLDNTIKNFKRQRDLHDKFMKKVLGE